MNRLRRFPFALVLLTALAQPAAADIVTDWNRTATSAMVAAGTGLNPSSRNLAMLHVAMADAVNAIQKKYALYAPGGTPVAGASAEAAAAAAARGILLNQLPGQKALIEQAYEASIKAIPEGAARTDGIAVGERCAAAVIADRAADGTSAPDTYRPITAPGVWIPTVPAVFAMYAQARPWVLKSADQLRPPPPPALASALYARDYNEVKEMGGTKSSKRTPEQTEAVKFWTAANLGFWQDIAAQLADAKKLSLAENARLFALLNMGIANTFIIDWDAKFTYNFWRPVTAIRNGDQDGNDATERDAGWTSLNANPQFPEYPSQAAIVAGVSTGILEAVVGANPSTPVVATDVANARLQRRFANVQLLADEIRNVRVWGGIHFRTSVDVGYDMGRKIAVILVEGALKPLN